jgi:regulator of cell morphogenesis and NO signaling
LENLKFKSVGTFIADKCRSATVFQKHGIDFCCKEGKTIDELCESKKISADELLTNLNTASAQ